MSSLNGNVFKSIDAGETWETAATRGRTFRAMEISPTFISDQTILVGGARSKIMRSIDGGTTWEDIVIEFDDS